MASRSSVSISPVVLPAQRSRPIHGSSTVPVAARGSGSRRSGCRVSASFAVHLGRQRPPCRGRRRRRGTARPRSCAQRTTAAISDRTGGLERAQLLRRRHHR
jgi:hypothetical protein